MQKIIILIINSNKYPSNISVPFIKQTWGKNLPKNIELYFVEDSEFETRLVKNHIQISTEFRNQNDDPVSYRMKYAFKWVEENLNFDILYRATTTCYIDMKKLNNFVTSLNSRDLYAGENTLYPPILKNPAFPQTNENDKTIEYANGAGYFLSRDVVERININSEKLSLTHYDDVSLGYLMEELGIIRTDAEHKNLQFFPKKNNLDHEVFHYRFKFGKFSILKLPRFLEVLMIVSLHSISNFEYYSFFGKLFTQLSNLLFRFLFHTFKFLSIVYKYIVVSNPK